MAIAPGGKAAHKRLNPTAANVPRLSLVAAVTAVAAVVSRINGSEPMQNDQEHFFSDIFLKFYNIIKI
jgi:hypothetical protein